MANGSQVGRLLRGQRLRAAVLGILMIAAALTEGLGVVLLVPLLGAVGGSALPGGGAGGWFSLPQLPRDLTGLLVLFVGLVALRGIIVLLRSQAALRFETAVVDALRRRAWHGLLQADWRALSTMRQSQNASLLITNIDRVGSGLQQALTGIAALTTLGALGLAALAIAPWAAVVGAAGGGAVMIAYRGMRRHAARLGQQFGEAYDAMHERFGEALRALRTIKSIEAEDRAERWALDGIGRLRRAKLAYGCNMALGQLALHTGGAAVLATMTWLALARWNMGLAAILPLIALFTRALPLLGTVQESWQFWAHSRPAITASLALIDSAEAAREPDDAGVTVPDLLEGIELHAVSVCYPGQDGLALDAVGLAIPARSTVALVGESGAGKSTLADLIGGLISPDSGTMLVDGMPITLANRRGWRRHVAYVQQEPVLFTGTLRENLLLADPLATDAQIRAALVDAAASFVFGFPDVLETRVGEGGRGLSGGERQRLMLARALLRRPALLILDEATSALDAASESAVHEALSRLRGRMTILIVSHRGALLQLADRIVTMRGGHIAQVEQNGG